MIIREQDAQLGCILWLPPKNKLPASSIALDDRNKDKIDDDGFNHPVVVIDGRQRLVVVQIVELLGPQL